ncbi:MAG: TetR family transcriptional regulator [Arenimonas sp. SCN 70-307]|uniref:TetR/AcrR family transcriptional regulator n=1 Tax=Arenimonas sp. SCN 70-307 TaxID=1660089 RepID=UPI0008693E97|nr:TetR/AcrR family transcriptional regulator [Arenimonas sp. SCN 70-307]ODS61489.1 MAG: TetR family transcriptional regulator [Arenimonas sp. SCN 70-307]
MTEPSPRVSPGRPKDLEKRAAILDAAKALFLARGYEGTAMDAVAQAAGVSKLTVYSHFQDKETLFVEAVKASCEDLLPADLFDVHFQGPIRQQLLRIGRALFRLITSDEAIAVHRIMGQPMPEGAALPQLFWDAGPRRIQEAFAGFLRAEAEAGELAVRDCELAAQQFFALLKGECHARLLCGCPATLAGDALDRHLAATVDMFLRAYGPVRA